MPKRKKSQQTEGIESPPTNKSQKKKTSTTATTTATKTNHESLTDFNIPYNDKPILCSRHGRPPSASSPSLLFTHGAGGGITSPATQSFASGFGRRSRITVFQGNANLQSRTKMFHAVLEHETATALGGRSMGARAAVLTALERRESALVLVSYPLLAAKGRREPERRERILRDLAEGVDVLFMVGSLDAQCDLEVLGRLRREMRARSWLVEVRGADHGMGTKGKKGEKEMRVRSGVVAAEWLRERDGDKRECLMELDEEGTDVVCSGWTGEAENKGS